MDSGKFMPCDFTPGRSVRSSRRQDSGSSKQCLICFNDLKLWNHESKMLSKYLVISLLLNVPFTSCVEDDVTFVTCVPESLCNTTFSDPASLKTRSDNILHIGVSLRIIDKNNVRENATRAEFNDGFKVRH